MNGDGQVEFPLVNRVEVIDSTGRVFVEYLDHLGVSVQMQDNGRTMKLFVSGPGKRDHALSTPDFFAPAPVKIDAHGIGLKPAKRKKKAS